MKKDKWFWPILLLGLLLRVGVLLWKFPELTEDRDAYLAIARGLSAGEGFQLPGSAEPTAFRPPLFPLLLSLAIGIGGVYGVALLQLLGGLACVWGTMCLARELGLQRGVWLAGLIAACDPLLLRYTVQPMTEVTSAALGIWLLWAWVRAEKTGRWPAQLGAGVLFGLSVLCRPSLLPLPLVVLALQGMAACWRSRSNADSTAVESAKSPSLLAEWRTALVIAGVGFLVLLPWGLRNALVLGQFKLTTTHGGYTLLLGNNPVFYKAVVQQPWGTTWGDYAEDDPLSQASWFAELNRQLAQQGAITELQRDRAEYQLALQAIHAEPELFLRACLLRQLRLWSPWPIGPEAAAWPRLLIWLVAGFYLGVYGLAVIGLWRQLRSVSGCSLWLPCVAVLLTLASVHLFYWTNARMRAPVMPVIAVCAGGAIAGRAIRRP